MEQTVFSILVLVLIATLKTIRDPPSNTTILMNLCRYNAMVVCKVYFLSMPWLLDSSISSTKNLDGLGFRVPIRWAASQKQVLISKLQAQGAVPCLATQRRSYLHKATHRTLVESPVSLVVTCSHYQWSGCPAKRGLMLITHRKACFWTGCFSQHVV